MPIYEYRCENGHVFDMMQRMSEASLTICVKCDAPVKKVLHPVGISFKGSGFYSTDYNNKATKSESKETAKTGESTTNGTSNSEGSGEKKPEKTTSTEPVKKAE